MPLGSPIINIVASRKSRAGYFLDDYSGMIFLGFIQNLGLLSGMKGKNFFRGEGTLVRL